MKEKSVTIETFCKLYVTAGSLEQQQVNKNSYKVTLFFHNLYIFLYITLVTQKRVVVVVVQNIYRMQQNFCNL